MTVDLLDDDAGPSGHDDVGIAPALAEMPTEEAVRYLMSFGTAEMDAPFLVAVARGELVGDARAVNPESDARTT